MIGRIAFGTLCITALLVMLSAGVIVLGVAMALLLEAAAHILGLILSII